jgi:nucleoprotein TPR
MDGPFDSQLWMSYSDQRIQSIESRLQSDFRSVQSERARLQQLIENLNNVNTESERTRVEERNRLMHRIEELQRER